MLLHACMRCYKHDLLVGMTSLQPIDSYDTYAQTDVSQTCSMLQVLLGVILTHGLLHHCPMMGALW